MGGCLRYIGELNMFVKYLACYIWYHDCSSDLRHNVGAPLGIGSANQNHKEATKSWVSSIRVLIESRLCQKCPAPGTSLYLNLQFCPTFVESVSLATQVLSFPTPTNPSLSPNIASVGSIVNFISWSGICSPSFEDFAIELKIFIVAIVLTQPFNGETKRYATFNSSPISGIAFIGDFSSGAISSIELSDPLSFFLTDELTDGELLCLLGPSLPGFVMARTLSMLFLTGESIVNELLDL